MTWKIGREKIRALKDSSGGDRKTAIFEDIFGDCRGKDSGVWGRFHGRRSGGAIDSTILGDFPALMFLPWLERVSFRLDAFAHEMADNIDPFAIPAQHPAPNLVGFKRLYLFPKATAHAT